MKWAERDDVLSYIIDCYQGVENRTRQFIWETGDGDIVIGNARAFANHLSHRFGIRETPTSWMSLHEVLRAVGEVVEVHSPRTKKPGRKFKNQEPQWRVIRKAGTR